MIQIMFRLATEHILVSIRGNKITFANTEMGNIEATIDGLRLSKAGVIKEFPDLEGDNEWAKKAVDRFKAKIRSLETEDAKVTYIVEDLKKHGYIPIYKQKEGFRIEKI